MSEPRNKPHAIIGCKDGVTMEFSNVSTAAVKIGCAVSTVRRILQTGIEYDGWTLDYKLTDKEIDMIKESDTKPFKFTLRRNAGQLQLTLHFCIEHLDPQEGMPADMPEFMKRYKFHQVTLPPSEHTYEHIVSAVFNEVFSNDQFQAIIANHLLDPEDEEKEAEYQQLQEFRRAAKQYAKEVLAEIEAIPDIDEYLRQQATGK